MKGPTKRFVNHKGKAYEVEIKKMKSTNIGILDMDEEIKGCIPCIEGKQSSKPFPKGEAKRATEKLEIVHSDICGPMRECSWGGARYLLTFTDDYSRKSFGYLLKQKSQIVTQTASSLVENPRSSSHEMAPVLRKSLSGCLSRRPTARQLLVQKWRYSTRAERLITLLGVLFSWAASFAVLSAVIIYGELTALFVSRHKAEETPATPTILGLFGGARVLPPGNRTLHMDALLEDSIAFAWASCAVMAFQLTVSAAAVGLANWAAGSMIKRLRWKLLRSVISQEIGFFDTNTSMNFASALTEDMEKLKAGVGEHVAMTTYLCGTVIFGACLSMSYGWELTLAGLAVVPAAVMVQHICAKYQTRCSSKEVKCYSTAGRIVEGALSNIRTVRAYGGEELEVKTYVQALQPATKQVRRRGLWAGIGTGLGWFLTYCINATVLAYGAWLCVQDLDLPTDEKRYHPGVMVTVLFMTFMAAQNTAMCNPHLEVISNARGAAKSLFKLLERRSKIDPMADEGLKPQTFRGDIVFNNIYFNYPSRPDVKILRGLTLAVKAGDTVALVGSSGCGKSTLLQLLQRMYDPESGSISVDGHRLDELNLHHYRSHIGVVGQEPVLFSGTIRDNITLGLGDVTEQQLVAAATVAHAHQFITKLADGYDTMLGERGAQLSGGQKQRIAIARAVVRNPKILLLDEPTSALDPAAERLVQAALDEASVGRTTLVVSHRLSTIVNATRIVYIEQGVVLEQGTHLELLEKKGAYCKLVQEDMTNKSIATAMAAAALEDDDELGRWQPSEVQRTPSRMSFTRESTLRGSARLGAGAAHVASLATEMVDHVEPSEEDLSEDQPPQVSNWKLLKLNAPEWHLLLGGGISAFLIGAIMPFFAVLFSKLYGMFSSNDGDEILRQSRVYAGLFALVAALCGVITCSQAWLFNRAGARLTDRLRETTFRNFLKQEQGWFDHERNSVGALCARLASDCAAVQGATGTRLGTVLQGISTMVIGVGLSMAYSWKMTLASLVSVPCVIGGIYMEGLVMRRTENKERKSLEQASRIATEAVMNVRTVQSLGIEAVILSRYSSALNEASKRARAAHYVRGPVYGICMCAPTLGYGVSLAYGGYLVAREGLSYEYAILVSEALIYGAWMLAEALSFAPSFAAARRAGARIVAALERIPLIVTEETAVFDPDWAATGAVNFTSVHFRYPTRPNVPVLKDLTLELTPGQTVALVGASGCGKSTLLQLLMRGYDLDSGSTTLDGRDIKRDLTLPQLRAQLGLVQQEPALFERTIRENIAYGDNSREVAIEEVMKAAQQANVHGFIASLPMGYDTRLGQGGAALSGGQKQRIAIARALVRNPRVLLLDEATSALDANSEKVVQAALEEASKERTTIIIAHRLATVQHAHKICVIDKGKVAESGTHEELVRKRGLYFDLLQNQGPTS